MQRIWPAVLRLSAALGVALSAGACGGGAGEIGDSLLSAPRPDPLTAQRPPGGRENLTALARPNRTRDGMREVPALFSTTEAVTWDGAPTLEGLWVAHPEVEGAEQVRIRNPRTGTVIDGALLPRRSTMTGDGLLISAEAADALGLVPGVATEVSLVAIRPVRDAFALADAGAARPGRDAYAPVTASDTAEAGETAAAAPPAPPATQTTSAPAARTAAPASPAPAPATPSYTRREQPVAPATVAEASPPDPQPATPRAGGTPPTAEDDLAALSTSSPAKAADDARPAPPQPQPQAEPAGRSAAAPAPTTTKRQARTDREAQPAASTAPATDTPTEVPYVPAVVTAPATPPAAPAGAPIAPSTQTETAIPDGRRYIQAGYFAVPEHAADLVRTLSAQGIPASNTPAEANGKKLNRVVAGPFASEQARERAMKVLRAIGIGDARPASG